MMIQIYQSKQLKTLYFSAVFFRRKITVLTNNKQLDTSTLLSIH